MKNERTLYGGERERGNSEIRHWWAWGIVVRSERERVGGTDNKGRVNVVPRMLRP